MSLDLGMVGAVSEPHEHAYGWRDQALYALGIGAKRDELAYLYEGHPGGMKAFPTYVVIPAFVPVRELMARAGVEMRLVIHGAQEVTVHRPLPPEGRMITRATLENIYDLKRFAQVMLTTRTTIDGEPVADTEWTIIVRERGGFGGSRPPPSPAPRISKEAEPLFRVEDTTLPEQALLYRLSGDHNPLHADPVVAAEAGFSEGPILHGLSTFGYVARACVRAVAGGDADRLRRLRAQFKRPVWPGDTIVTEGFRHDDGRIILQALAGGRPDPVVAGAWVEIEPTEDS